MRTFPPVRQATPRWYSMILPAITAIALGFGIALFFMWSLNTIVEGLDNTVSQKVDSRWQGGPSDWSTSLDYMELHPVCRDALRSYVVTYPTMVAYMCNMVGDIWVADLMKEHTP